MVQKRLFPHFKGEITMNFKLGSSRAKPGRPRAEDRLTTVGLLSRVSVVLGVIGKTREYWQETGPFPWTKLTGLSNGNLQYSMTRAQQVSEWMVAALREHVLECGTDQDKQDYELNPNLVHPAAQQAGCRTLFNDMLVARIDFLKRAHTRAVQLHAVQNEKWEQLETIQQAQEYIASPPDPNAPMERL